VDLDFKKVLVVGAGKSGIAASLFLAAKGAEVELTDFKSPAKLSSPASLTEARIKLSLGSYPVVGPGKYTLVVVSPGVPLTAVPVRSALEAGIPVVGELELAVRFVRAPVVAITGTNGKTTTTALVGKIFQNAGYHTLVAGNIGKPLIEEAENDYDVIVLEVSSFQLETAFAFKPGVGAVLNITPDHLDRHLTVENYALTKARLFANQDPHDFAVLNYDDQRTKSLSPLCPGKVVYFSRMVRLPEGVFVQDGQIVYISGGQSEYVLPVKELKIPGAHNLENALAAVACCRSLGVGTQALAGTLCSFAGVAHRLELVGVIDGVRYVNDSKGTNPDASIKALGSYDAPVVLIAGGRNKGNDFAAFARAIKEKVRALVLLGESAGEIGRLAQKEGVADIRWARNMEDAVCLARGEARTGDVVLLSPGCASWDMFANYEERGDLFKKIVLEMS